MKPLALSLLAGLLLVPASLHAADTKSPPDPQPFTLTTTKGVVYKKARVMGVDPDGLRITHSSGAAKVPYEVLDDTLLAKYQFDPEKAAAFRAERERVVAERAAAEQQAALAAAEEKEESAFNLFRTKILTTIEGGAYDYAKLDATLGEWIKVYIEAGKAEWASLLQDDRDLLKSREGAHAEDAVAQRTKQLEDENARLQSQIDLLKGAVQESRDQEAAGNNTRTVTIYDTPYVSPYYYYNRPPVIVVTPPLKPPVVCPPTTPHPHPHPIPSPHPTPSVRPAPGLAPSADANTSIIRPGPIAPRRTR